MFASFWSAQGHVPSAGGTGARGKIAETTCILSGLKSFAQNCLKTLTSRVWRLYPLAELAL